MVSINLKISVLYPDALISDRITMIMTRILFQHGLFQRVTLTPRFIYTLAIEVVHVNIGFYFISCTPTWFPIYSV